ncbi:SUKH-4 family immunity protein [Streptomyces chitinivorans]|uniref:SUKH-4 family immunity protein n=1 Tax=Streptomyces chitinivorans TaxID=1257027 RepID=A0ABW7HWW0_9ACTN|nr:SUKH-4 family immunity protein [Streptomyces chitinivorans]MDH2407522.1 SUKH-4 family immunity protein [Streptomyces chitinivorans]
MVSDIQPEEVRSVFGISNITYFPLESDAHIHRETARFLSAIGLPSTSFFTVTLDPEDQSPFEFTPSLRLAFEEDGVACPPGSERWEILGQFVYADVALDPEDGRVYSFPEGEGFYVPMHADVSSLVHALITLEEGRRRYTRLPDRDLSGYSDITDWMRKRITAVDETPFAGADGEWSKVFEEIALGMWG